MVQNPPDGCQRVIPCLLYGDAAGAIAFLCRAFGFEERLRLDHEGGAVLHAELAVGDNVLRLATARPEEDQRAPPELPGLPCSVVVYVDDVDAHCARAREAGATIECEPEDSFGGERAYRARDPEGHRWQFVTRVRDVDLGDGAG